MSILTQPWGNRKPSVGYGVDPSHPHSRGLLGLWLMNEGGGGNIQDSCRKNVGLLNGLPGWCPAKTGGGLIFSGSNYVSTINTLVASSWSFEFMFCKTGAGTGASRIIGANPSSYSNDIAIAEVGFSGLTVGCLSVCNVVGTWASYGPVLSTNTWYHGVVTFDGTNTNVYLNGVPQTLTSGNGPCGTTNTAIVFADYVGHGGGGGNQFIGKLDWVAMWNRALTYTEVKERYVEPFAFMQTPTIIFGASSSKVPVIMNQYRQRRS